LVVPVLAVTTISTGIQVQLTRSHVEESVAVSLRVAEQSLQDGLNNLTEIATALLNNPSLAAINQSPRDETETLFGYARLIGEMQMLSLTGSLDSQIQVFLLARDRVLTSHRGLLPMSSYYERNVIIDIQEALDGWAFRPTIDWTGAPTMRVLSTARRDPVEQIYVTVELTLDSVQRFVNRLSSELNATVFLSDGTTTVVAGDQPDARQKPPVVPIVPEGYVGSTRQMMATDLVVGWYIASEELLRPLRQALALLVVVVSASALASAAFLAVARRNFVDPLRRLFDAMGKVKLGDLSARLENTRDKDFDFLNGQFNRMVTRIEALIAEVGIEHTKYERAQLRFLQAQVDPHFMFNSLYFAYQMCEGGDTEAAGNLLLEMGDYYRYTASLTNPSATITEELDNVRNYISIYRMRYGDGIELQEHLCPAVMETRIPKLTLQPLVENCFKHGFSTSPTQGRIDISVWESQGVVYIRLADTGIGISDREIERLNKSLDDMTLSPHQPIGLRNTHWRLRLRYRGHAGLRVDRDAGASFSVTVFITPDKDTYDDTPNC